MPEALGHAGNVEQDVHPLRKRIGDNRRMTDGCMRRTRRFATLFTCRQHAEASYDYRFEGQVHLCMQAKWAKISASYSPNGFVTGDEEVR